MLTPEPEWEDGPFSPDSAAAPQSGPVVDTDPCAVSPTATASSWGGGLLLRLPPGRDGGLGGNAVRPLQRHAARVVLAKVLVEDGLEREALAADVAMKGLVARVLADVILQLILAGVLLPTHAADERRDAHVQTHVPVQAALLVEGFGTVNAGEPWVVPEPAL